MQAAKQLCQDSRDTLDEAAMMMGLPQSQYLLRPRGVVQDSSVAAVPVCVGMLLPLRDLSLQTVIE